MAATPRQRPARLARVAASAAAIASALPLGALLLASSPGLTSRAGAQVVTQQTFSYDGASPQTFTVPPAVTDVQIAASGGQGGAGAAFSGSGESPAPGGAGDEVQGVDLAVTPGEQLTVDVGGAGGSASSSNVAGGTGGPSGANGADTLTGGTGGPGTSGSAGAGGGGGGASAVWDGNQLVVLAAGGGGGGGASTAADGLDGGAGGQGTVLADQGGVGNGSAAPGSGGGAGGFFAANFSPVGGDGQSGAGGAGGGGGAGYLDNALGYSGGGTGGFAGSGAGGGGGGGGVSFVSSATFGSPSHGPSAAANGSVTLSWLPSDAVSVAANGPGQTTTGEPVTYTATVTTSGGAPDGQVTFFDGDNPIANCQALAVEASGNSGNATCTVTYDSAGSHSLSARYAGDSTFPLASSTPVVEQAVTPPLTLTSSAPAPVATGAPVLLAASVTVTGQAVDGTVPLGGTVSFFDDGKTVASCRGSTPLPTATSPTTTTGIASCEDTFTTIGTHTLTAIFRLGNADPATSSPLTLEVQAPATLYVTASGADTDNTTCSSTSPCATLAHAVAQAIGGDTISLGAGTFAGGVTATIPLTVTGQGPATVLEAAPEAAGELVGLGLEAGGTVENLSITFPVGNPEGVGVEENEVNAATATVSHVTVAGDDEAIGVAAQAGRTIVAYSSLTSLAAGVGVEGGSLTLLDSSVTGSSVDGVVSLEPVGNPAGLPEQLAIVDSTVSGTTATLTPGVPTGFGVVSETGSTAVTDSTIADNSAGGVDAVGGTVSALSSTVANNGGPGLDVTTDDATVWMAGSLLAANDGGDCQAPLLVGPSGIIEDAGFNLVDDTTCTTASVLEGAQGDVLDADPMVSPLAANGGPTETEAPASGGPAIGTIPTGTSTTVNGTTVELCEGTDQRGVPRPEPAGAPCDMGAVELAPSTVSVSFTPKAPVTDHPVTLRATVTGTLSTPTLPLPQGTVTFRSAGRTLVGCRARPLSSGTATCTTTLRAGKVPVAARFTGTNGYLGSSASPIMVKVAAS